MAANDAVSMNVAENRQNVPMAIQENRAAVPMTVAEGGGAGGLNRKADKVTGAAAGNLAGLDANGNLTDSGKAPGDFLEAPAAAGSEGQVLTADGEGGASWQDPTGGDPTEIIDDNAGSGDTDKVWSADKSHSLLTEINSKYEKPETGIPSSDMASAVQNSLGKADSAYQKPKTGIPGADLSKELYREIIDKTPVFTAWEQGDIGYAAGTESPSTTKCRTIGYFEPDADTEVYIDNPNGHTLALRDYYSSDTYAGSAAITSYKSYTFKYGHKYRIVDASTGDTQSVTAKFYYINNNAVRKIISYKTVSDLVLDTDATIDRLCMVKGYHTENDGGAALYIVSNEHTGVFYLSLSNGLYANLVNETKIISADVIGLKHYATKALAEADSAGANANRTKAQAALSSGFSLKFGAGYYPFDNYLTMVPNTDLYGEKRELSTLVFPNSIGLNYITESEFSYQRIKDLRIYSKGNCINIDAIVRNVINCIFDYLELHSAEGECIVAPRYNIGSRQGDTCVWSCYFGHINGDSETGAVFTNISGLGNWFYFINVIGNTRIAFRNCSGTVQRLDTLTTRPEYCFYYDDVNNYGLALTLIDVHFERCSKAFIYTEDETAGTMGLSIFAIDSGGSNLNLTNHDIPFIKVGFMGYLYHFGKCTLLPPESMYDMQSLHGALIHAYAFNAEQARNFKTNLGDVNGLNIYCTNDGSSYKFYGGYTYLRAGSNPYYVRELFDTVGIKKMYGSRSHVMMTITDDDLPVNTQNIELKNINSDYEFSDYVTFEITETTSNVNLKTIKTGDICPGKVFGIRNSDNSTATITLNVPAAGGDDSTHCLAGLTAEVLNPGETINLILDYDNSYLRWKKISIS